MQKNISEKLKSYSTIAALSTLAAFKSDGQIIYTDINPDTTLVNLQSYGLDLDNDGNYDYVFGVSDVNYSGSQSSLEIKRVSVTPYQSGFAIAASSANSYVYPVAFNANTNIGPLLNWIASSDQSMASVWFSNGSPGYYGNFIGAKNKFIAFKFLINGNNHYGWARVDVAQLADTITIKDYAYNQNPNENILTGEGTPSSVGTFNLLNDAIIFNSNKLKIVCNDFSSSKASIRINDETGREILSQNINQPEMVIDMNSNPSGVYMVHILSNNQYMKSKKIVVTH